VATTTATQKESVSQTVGMLTEIGKLDTLFRDVYLQRARELMSQLLPYSSFTYIKENTASIGWIERQLRAAVERGNWDKSRELTERLRTLKSSLTANAESMKLGESVYEGLSDIPIDPFSEGFHIFVGGSKEKLLELRHRAVAVLDTLERTDQSKKDLYLHRKFDFNALVIKTDQKSEAQTEKSSDDPVKLRQDALSALESGNLTQLDELVQKLSQKAEVKEEKKETAENKPAESVELGTDLIYSFSEATLAAAKEFGLTPVRTKSRRQLAYLRPHGWQPSFRTDEVRKWSKDQLTRLSYPSGTGDKAREAIEFYLLNPFINSGGSRYEVCFVVEDLLLEVFPEPEPRQQIDPTRLLSALGFDNRWSLSRLEIENALLQHGPRIVAEELKLDTELFRLIVIPADIYTHLGADFGWGQKEMWTHFDGYRVLEGGKLQALGGGDTRFGGTFDVVSFAPAYSSDKILARFAVVQRKRMMSWHRK
jgi:hypothetical protein